MNQRDFGCLTQAWHEILANNKRGALFYKSHSLLHGDLCPCDDSDYSTTALSNPITLAETFSLNGSSQSERVRVVEDDDWPQPCLNGQNVKSTGSCETKLTDL